VPGFGESHVIANLATRPSTYQPQTVFSTIQIKIEEYFDEKVFILGRHCHGTPSVRLGQFRSRERQQTIALPSEWSNPPVPRPASRKMLADGSPSATWGKFRICTSKCLAFHQTQTSGDELGSLYLLSPQSVDLAHRVHSHQRTKIKSTLVGCGRERTVGPRMCYLHHSRAGGGTIAPSTQSGGSSLPVHRRARGYPSA
jgi:hypothetical protein